MKYLETVINSGIFGELNKSEYIEAFEQLKITGKTYKRNETVFYEDDVIDKICIVVSGTVRAEKIYPDGEVHILAMFEENAIFGMEFAISRAKTTAIDYICNEKTTVAFISLKSINENKHAAKLSKALTYMLADENIRMMHKTELLAERGLRNRIMVYFRVLQGKAKSDSIDLRMSREQLAQYLCVNRSALSNELSKMKAEGIIDIRGSKVRLLK